MPHFLLQFVTFSTHFYNLRYLVMMTQGVLKALDHILDTSNYPLHIMCHLGRHQTGTVVGCLRKLQRWNLTAVFEEYRSFAGDKVGKTPFSSFPLKTRQVH